MTSSRTPPALAAATTAWCLAFLVPHAYWAAGGRADLGTTSLAADRAFDQPLFVAYNGAAMVACTVGAVAALLLPRTTPRGRPRTISRVIALASGGALLARGAVGLVDLAVGAAQGGAASPLVLVLVEPAFVLGGALWLVLGLTLRGRA